ncbi:MAG: HutD family protein [Alphaproteobacteria bacterium]|nr:HutD family protein [Alphaproteobacteria bacterium]
MTSFIVIRAGAHRVMPWKNGGGATAEIAIHPPGASVASGFDWRLSIATVASDGPFSAFPRHDRVIVLLSGNGMTLVFDDGVAAHLDRAFEPLRFRGDRAAHCRLTDGACEDLNLMVDRASHEAVAAVIAAGAWPGDAPRDSTRLLFLLRGSAELGVAPTPALALRTRDTLVVMPGEAAPAVRLSEGALAFTATIRLGAGA